MIVPGSVNPFLLTGNPDPLDELGAIPRSLRFRGSVSAYLYRNPASASNRKTFTYSAWVKRGLPGTESFVFAAADYVTHNGNNVTFFSFAPDDTFKVYNSGYANFFSTEKFRDPAAHYHVVIAIDTTQAVATDRVKVWINNRLLTFSPTWPQNLDTTINSTYRHGIGAYIYDPVYFDGYVSHAAFIDGQALTPSGFGLAHPITGQWRPKTKAQVKTVADAGGANSFFLPFDDPTNTTTLCTDASSKGNNWTPVNISLTAGATYDSMTDTPTRNSCSLSGVAKCNVTLSDAGLNIFSGAGSVSWGSALGTMPLPSGKWYFEAVITSLNTGGSAGMLGMLGVAPASASVTGSSTIAVGDAGYGWGAGIGTIAPAKRFNGGNTTIGAGTITLGDVLMCAVDIDAGKIWFGRNGTWFEGNPATGATPSFTGLTGPLVPMLSSYYDAAPNAAIALNAGQRAFSYTAPAGFLAPNTKNLPIPTNGAVIKPASAFAAVTDTGANIQTTLANARSGWGAYIEIFKRRDATAEGWRWRFSDDVANYLDSSSTAAKAAFPALTAGGSYSGYAIKVAASNGVAMGRLVHTNGVADTVTDGLANSRKAIILKNEATGVWYFYHPDLTAGKLLYLEQTTAETTDATLGTVLSNSFVVAAALASGTYRWIAFAELSGFLSLRSYIANGAADGPVLNGGLSPAFTLQKSTSGSAGRVKDSARSTYNVSSLSFDINTTGAEDPSSNSVDFLSNGIKERANDAMNVSPQKFVTMLFAAFPFRYANAR